MANSESVQQKRILGTNGEVQVFTGRDLARVNATHGKGLSFMEMRIEDTPLVECEGDARLISSGPVKPPIFIQLVVRRTLLFLQVKLQE